MKKKVVQHSLRFIHPFNFKPHEAESRHFRLHLGFLIILVLQTALVQPEDPKSQFSSQYT